MLINIFSDYDFGFAYHILNSDIHILSKTSKHEIRITAIERERERDKSKGQENKAGYGKGKNDDGPRVEQW